MGEQYCEGVTDIDRNSCDHTLANPAVYDPTIDAATYTFQRGKRSMVGARKRKGLHHGLMKTLDMCSTQRTMSS